VSEDAKSKEVSLPAEKPASNPLAPVNAPPDKPAGELTPEEQMALYEKDLRENDWGHQPC
jgi:hypothetical protein